MTAVGEEARARGRPAVRGAVVVAVLALGAAARLGAPGSDVPLDCERSEAPLQDALWYLEGAAGPVELGVVVEREPVYDPPVWTHVARTFFRVAGASWTSAHVLAGLVSVATLALTWRVARARLGPAAGLASAAALAALTPAVALGRTPLVYGPVTLALLAAAGAWLAVRRAPPAARLGVEALAWAAGAAAVALTRPPAAALLGGLLAATLARARRPGAALAGLALLAAAGLLVAQAVDPLGILEANRERLGRYLARDGSAAGLALRALRLGGEPRGALLPGGAVAATGTGFVALAPGACAAAALGALALLRRWRALPGGTREAGALALGWLAAFVTGAVALDARAAPLRYSLVIAPPLALLAGVGVAAVAGVGVAAARSAGPRPPGWAGVAGAVVGALAAAHGLELLAGPRGLGTLAAAAAPGAAAGAALVAFRSWPTPCGARLRRALALGLLAAVILPGAARAAVAVGAPTWRARDAQATVPAIVGSGASLVGPYASWAALGHGLARRRAAWIDASPAGWPATLDRLRAERPTHLVLGADAAASSGIAARLAASGVPATLVAVWAAPRLDPVLLLRFAWAAPASGFEVRRQADAEGGPVAAERDPHLLEARLGALVAGGQRDRAREVALRSGASPTLVDALARRVPALNDRP